MAQKSINITQFTGGISPHQKIGIPGSGRFVRYLNPHEDPSYITLTQGLTSVDFTDTLIKWAVDGLPWDTNKYLYGVDKLYKVNSGGTLSTVMTVGGGVVGDSKNGQGMLAFDDYIWIATGNSLSRIGRLSLGGTTQSYIDSLYSLTDQSATNTGNTYTPPVAISEAAADKRSFTPTRDPVKNVGVKVVAKGTGNWTVTVHDADNNAIASATIANASLSNGAINYFNFNPQCRVHAGTTYHFHVTSTVADGTLECGTAADLSTSTYTTATDMLVYDADWHMMMEHLNGIAICNEHYLAFWDGAVYYPNRITFAPGFKARTLAKDGEFIVIGCWKGTNIDDVEEGRLYYWDGISTTFNFFKPLTIGSPNALQSFKNRLFGVYGSTGSLYMGSEPFQKIQDAPQLTRGKRIEVYPGAITEWRGRLIIGMGGSTNDGTTFEQGLYEFGSKQDSQPEVLTYFYPIVDPPIGSSHQVTMAKAFGNVLYWAGSISGIPVLYKIQKSNSANGLVAGWESLIFDSGNPHKDMLAIKLVISFAALTSGQSVTPKYRINRATSWTSGTATTSSSTETTRAEFVIDKRCNEIEFGFDTSSTSNTYPLITGVFLLYDDLREEWPER